MKIKKTMWLAFALLIIASMVLTACGSAPVEEPAAPVVEEPAAPVEEAPVVEEPMEEVALNPYLGSNMLDGNGIPKDFFLDVHIRKAFSYCFNWDVMIDDIYQGEAIQSKVLSLPGMPGYDPEAPFYTMDLDKCAEEFQLADVDNDGIPAGEDPDDVWEMGFRFQMLYNTGNTTRQIMAEVLSANVSEVNDKFVIEVLGLPWPAYLTAQRAQLIPVMTAGWQEDIHDAHNWYQPYTTGAYGSRQGMPEEMSAKFKVLLDEGVALLDPDARHAVYQKFNQLYYDEVPGIPTVLATGHGYQQNWLQGRVLNPLFSGDLYKTMYKSEGAPNPDTITQATFGDADTFDPALAYDTASGEIIQNVYETLVFYDGVATDKFVPQLAESWEVSEDGTVWTFNIRQGVKFHEGGDMTPSDVAYSFQRGLLQGGYASPQWLLAEPFYGVGLDDVSAIVDEWASADDRESMMANDPAVLVAACERTKAAIVADDAAGTVTMTLAQPWGPFLPTIAQAWGSVMDMEWVVENGGWDGSCDTWQNNYAMTSAENPFSAIANGTGAYALDHWTPGEEIVLTAFDGYWGDPALASRVVISDVAEWGTRFAMLQAGDADFAAVPVENRTQVDAMVGEMQVFDAETNQYGETQKVCAVDTSKLGAERFTACEAGEEGNGGPFHLFIGRPGLVQQVIIYNMGLK